MTIKVVTDSTCDLPKGLLDQYDISVIPVYINIGGKSYKDQVDISRDDFYKILPGCKVPPTTSSPGIGAFVDEYQQLADNGASEIISVHLSENLSNVVNVARLAVDRVKSVKVHVLDSGNLSIATGFVALAAAVSAKAGKKVLDIIRDAEMTAKNTYAYAVLDNLEYLRRSGRLSNIKYNLSTLLDIKPILKMHNGIIKLEMVRTWNRATNRLIDLVNDMSPLSRLALVHTNARDKAMSLYDQVQSIFGKKDVLCNIDVTPAIGTHIGPGALGFVGTLK